MIDFSQPTGDDEAFAQIQPGDLYRYPQQSTWGRTAEEIEVIAKQTDADGRRTVRWRYPGHNSVEVDTLGTFVGQIFRGEALRRRAALS